MKIKTRIKSKASLNFSGNFTEAFLQKPLTNCKVALVSTAGVHLKSDKPFDVDNFAGDPTIRIIPSHVDESELTVTHLYIDTKFAKADPTIVFPLPCKIYYSTIILLKHFIKLKTAFPA